MKNLSVILLIALPVSVCAAELYKCRGANGSLSYGDKPCVVNAPEEGKITVREGKPSAEAVEKLKQLKTAADNQTNQAGGTKPGEQTGKP